MDCVIALKTDKFCLVLSDTTTSNSILSLHTSYPKIKTINDCLLAYCGRQSSASRLLARCEELMIYDTLRFNLSGPKTLANIVRSCVHESLRRRPYNVGCLVAGKNENKSENESENISNSDFGLYIIDEYGAMHNGSYFILGYARLFGYSILDMNYRKDMSVDEAILVCKKIVKCLKERLCLSYLRFQIRVLDSEGLREEFIESSGL